MVSLLCSSGLALADEPPGAPGTPGDPSEQAGSPDAPTIIHTGYQEDGTYVVQVSIEVDNSGTPGSPGPGPGGDPGGGAEEPEPPQPSAAPPNPLPGDPRLPRTTYYINPVQPYEAFTSYCVLHEEEIRPGQPWPYTYELCTAPNDTVPDGDNHTGERLHMLRTNVPMAWEISPTGAPGPIPYNGYEFIPRQYDLADGEDSNLVVRGSRINAEDPVQAADQVLANLEMPPITIRANPDLGLVNVPSWWWVEGYDGRPLSRTESVTLSVAGGGATAESIPPDYRQPYQTAGSRHNVPWQFIAAIGWEETRHGTYLGPTGRLHDGCIRGPVLADGSVAKGPMQFLDSSWARFGEDGNGDGRVNSCDIADAPFGTARHLLGAPTRLPGTAPDWRASLFAYNNDAEYVESVLATARSLGWDGRTATASSGIVTMSEHDTPPGSPDSENPANAASADSASGPNPDSCPRRLPVRPALENLTLPAGVPEIARAVFGRSGNAVTQGFGWSSDEAYDPYLGHENFHTGVDWDITQGDPLYAPYDGVARQEERSDGTWLIKLKLPSGHTLQFLHMARMVANGPVRAGDLLGYGGGDVGTAGAGHSSGSHLHLEMLPPGARYGAYVPPEHWTCLGGAPQGGVSSATVTVTVRPTGRYVWDFGDGTTRAGTLGRKYPQRSEVRHTYGRSSLGHEDGYETHLTVTFSGEYVVNSGPPQDLGLLEATYDGRYAVQEAQSVLTTP
jgi:murein DD-endopeptidase MepM/ murein hydrolase activator NlpD